MAVDNPTNPPPANTTGNSLSALLIDWNLQAIEHSITEI
jgi:hypothetical protein